MFEMRWVEYPVFFGEGIDAFAKIDKKLQYRYQRQDMHEFHPDKRWSEWIRCSNCKDLTNEPTTYAIPIRL